MPLQLHLLFCYSTGHCDGSLFLVRGEMIRMVDVLLCVLNAHWVMRNVGKKLVDVGCGTWFISLQADDWVMETCWKDRIY